MSETVSASHGTEHAHASVQAGHGHEDQGAPHGSIKSYLTGFILSAILTAIPFYLVMTNALSSPLATALVIMAFAAVQVVVHMICFLHMNHRTEGGWTLMALIFTVVVVGITLSGSMWVMYHMNANMMPGMSNMDMSGAPMPNAGASGAATGAAMPDNGE